MHGMKGMGGIRGYQGLYRGLWAPGYLTAFGEPEIKAFVKASIDER